jgi:hypothetical protein
MDSLESVTPRRYVGKGLLALSLTILVPTVVLIGALILSLLEIFLGIGGFVVGLVLLAIVFWWLWAVRRGFV